jgi:uncharacterized protein GlcG (DUF336 family)
MKLTLEKANALITAALAKGRELKLKPLCIAVLDSGGHLIALQREDGASFMRPQMAIAKAAGALGVGVSSRKLGEMAQERPHFMAALTPLSPGGMLPAAGGVILADEAGAPIGAVGVSGDNSDNDEACILAAAAAVGVKALS